MARILYIEDNPDNQRLVRRVLSSKGYTLAIAPEGATGLKLAQEERPDLILMDINLPGLTGYELTTKFKAIEQLADVPIIAITANTMVGDRERALAAGCDGYISKPIDPRALPSQVAEYLGGSREELPVADASTAMREYSQTLVARLEDHVRELEAANERLVALDKAKNEFLATISHELRTPLTVIHGYVDLLRLQALGPLDEQQLEAVTLIQRNSHRLLRHINDLIFLQQVRSSELQLNQVDFALLVARAIKDIRHYVDANTQTVAFEKPAEPLIIAVDEFGVEQAIRHIVENAALYSPPNATITVALNADEHYATLVISDTGIGISEEDQARIFEPFVRLDQTLAAVGGAGLGLTISKHVVEAHGGRIAVESAPGAGSTFTLVFPR